MRRLLATTVVKVTARARFAVTLRKGGEIRPAIDMRWRSDRDEDDLGVGNAGMDIGRETEAIGCNYLLK